MKEGVIVMLFQRHTHLCLTLIIVVIVWVFVVRLFLVYFISYLSPFFIIPVLRHGSSLSILVE